MSIISEEIRQFCLLCFEVPVEFSNVTCIFGPRYPCPLRPPDVLAAVKALQAVLSSTVSDHFVTFLFSRVFTGVHICVLSSSTCSLSPLNLPPDVLVLGHHFEILSPVSAIVPIVSSHRPRTLRPLRYHQPGRSY